MHRSQSALIAEPAAVPSWDALRAELDARAALGRPATLWWRDDDATAPTPALDRLLALATHHRVPLVLAVIPAPAEPALADRLRAEAGVWVVQHGWSHGSHAPRGEKPAELGDHRPAEAVLAELAEGRARLATLFGGKLLPVLAPPWNRIGPALRGRLAAAGYAGLTAFGPRQPGGRPSMVNTHVDIVDWRGTRGFVGADRALAALIGHLAQRRLGEVDPAEPTGLLTHHLVHDEGCWAFLDRLLAELAAHPTAAWPAPPDLFGAAP